MSFDSQANREQRAADDRTTEQDKARGYRRTSEFTGYAGHHDDMTRAGRAPAVDPDSLEVPG